MSKVNIEYIKRPVTDKRKIFARHISDKGLIPRILKEFLKFNKKQKRSETSRPSARKTRMDNKPMERFLGHQGNSKAQ